MWLIPRCHPPSLSLDWSGNSSHVYLQACNQPTPLRSHTHTHTHTPGLCGLGPRPYVHYLGLLKTWVKSLSSHTHCDCYEVHTYIHTHILRSIWLTWHAFVGCGVDPRPRVPRQDTVVEICNSLVWIFTTSSLPHRGTSIGAMLKAVTLLS